MIKKRINFNLQNYPQVLQGKLFFAAVINAMLLVIVILIVIYTGSRNIIIKELSNDFFQGSAIIENSIESVEEHVQEMSISLNNYLDEIYDELSKQQFDSVSFNSKLYQSSKYGFKCLPYGYSIGHKKVNSTIIFSDSLSTIRKDLYYKLSLTSLLLQDIQRAYHTLNKNIVLSYLISEKYLFSEIYPKVNIENILPEFGNFRKFEMSAFDVYRDFLYGKNTPRKPFWTNLYIDRAGNGHMVSCAAPIFLNDTLIGVVGSDIQLKFLDKRINELKIRIKNTISIINDSGDVIVSTHPAYSVDDTIAFKFKNLFSEDICKTVSHTTTYNGILSNKSKLIMVSKFKNAPWKIVLLIDKKRIFFTTLYELRIIFIILAIALILIPLVAMILYNKLILPGLRAEKKLFNINEELDLKVKKRTKELKEREKRLSITLNSIADCVITTDEKCNITHMNPSSEKILNFSFEEVRGKDINLFFTPLDPESHKKMPSPIIKVLTTKSPLPKFTPNALIRKNNNDEIIVAYSCAPIFDETRKITGTILVFRDITEKIELTNKLNQAHKMDAIGQLTGGIAHDFNNMLSGILSSAQLLQIEHKSGKPLSTSDADELIDIILTTTNRATQLTNKLLSFSRDENIRFKEIDIKSVLHETLSILERTLNKNIIIKTDILEEDVFVNGNSSELQNAILNLAINGSHAMPDGGILTFILAKKEYSKEYCQLSRFDIKEGTYIKLSVTDTGVGIDQRIIDKIFEPFFTTKNSEKGTGLGLASVYGTIKRHGGEITVDTKLGKGSTFSIILPMMQPTHNPKYSTENSPHTDNKVLNKTVLFVDDEEIIRITTSKILKSMGITTLTASNGLEAYMVYKKHRDDIDLVITDMIMPEMNGSELFKRLKELDKECKIILISGFTKDGNINFLLNEGLLEVISKPFDVDDFKTIVLKYI